MFFYRWFENKNAKWRVTCSNSDFAQKLSKTKIKQKVDSQKEMDSRDGGGETLVCQGMWRDFLHRCTRSARAAHSARSARYQFHRLNFRWMNIAPYHYSSRFAKNLLATSIVVY